MSELFEDPGGHIERIRQRVDERLWAQEMLGPEYRIDPDVSEAIIGIVSDLVDNHGSVSDNGVFKTGDFLARSEAIPGQPHKIPRLQVEIPVSEGFSYLAEINFLIQDAKLSQRVLLNRDATVRVTGYDGRPDTFMSKNDTVHFLESLKKVSAEIKEDLS